MIETLLLVLFALAAVVGAVLMVLMRHPMRVALALICTMISLGGIYGLLGVHVIAVFQIMIYVSAVMVFMVYAIMLLDVRDPSFTGRFSALLWPGPSLSSQTTCNFCLAENAAHVESATMATPGTRPARLLVPSRMKASFTPGSVLMRSRLALTTFPPNTGHLVYDA